jgi:hypothetical protein
MNILNKLTMAFSALTVVGALSLGAPALAQDAFGSGPGGGSSTADQSLGEMGNQAYGTQTTGSQTQQLQLGQSPTLQGATNGTISLLKVLEATVVQGVNTAGTVRVNNLANLEALLNIIANGMEILGIAWGGPTMIMGFMHMAAGSATTP